MQAIQTTLFDYAALDAETRIVVQQRTTEIKALMKRAASDIIEAGMKSIEIRSILRHNKGGGFDGWIQHEGMESRMIYHFIRVAETFGNFENFSKLNIGVSALYLLAAPSTPESARIEAIARAEEGEPITHSLARGIIHDHKEPALPFVPDEDDEYESGLTDYERRSAIRYLQGQAEDLGVNVIIQEESNAPINFSPAASVEWYTPARYIEAARAVMGGIETDPASNETTQAIIQAETYYTEETNGFDKPWRGRVWLNPPYGVERNRAVAALWTERLIEQFDAGITDEAILLVNAVIDSKWFNQLWRFPMCLTNHRIRFDVPDGANDVPNSPVIGSAIVYLGP